MSKEIGGQFSQLEEATIVQLQTAMATGQLTARRLVEMYLERIQFLDQRGPHFNAVLEINPDALAMVRRQNFSNLHMRWAEGVFNAVQKRSSGKQHAEQEAAQPPIEIGQLRRLNELLLRFLPIGVAVIDRSYHILTANGSASYTNRCEGRAQDF